MRYTAVVSRASLVAGIAFMFSTSAWAAGGISAGGVGSGGIVAGIGGAIGGVTGSVNGALGGSAAGGGVSGSAAGALSGSAAGGVASASASAGGVIPGANSGGAGSGAGPSTGSGAVRVGGPIGAFDGPSGLSATSGRDEFGGTNPSGAWASLPGLDPNVMGAPLPGAASLTKNNRPSARKKEARSGTETTPDGPGVEVAAQQRPGDSALSLTDAMVDTSKERAQGTKTARLGRIRKVRKARYSTYSRRPRAHGQLVLSRPRGFGIYDAEGNLRTRLVPAKSGMISQ